MQLYLSLVVSSFSQILASECLLSLVLNCCWKTNFVFHRQSCVMHLLCFSNPYAVLFLDCVITISTGKREKETERMVPCQPCEVTGSEQWANHICCPLRWKNGFICISFHFCYWTAWIVHILIWINTVFNGFILLCFAVEGEVLVRIWVFWHMCPSDLISVHERENLPCVYSGPAWGPCPSLYYL